jgi:hypothetical protein
VAFAVLGIKRRHLALLNDTLAILESFNITAGKGKGKIFPLQA